MTYDEMLDGAAALEELLNIERSTRAGWQFPEERFNFCVARLRAALASAPDVTDDKPAVFYELDDALHEALDHESSVIVTTAFLRQLLAASPPISTDAIDGALGAIGVVRAEDIDPGYRWNAEMLAKDLAAELNRNWLGQAIAARGGLRRILIALAQRPGLDNRQLGLRSGLSSQSGTFSTYLARARSANWVRDEGDRRFITDDGLTALGTYEPLPEGRELLAYWLGELGNSGAARMLRALSDVYPNSLSNEELGERAEISAASGTFSTYMSRLRGLELVKGGRGKIRMSEELAG